jgi:hypothetical protein
MSWPVSSSTCWRRTDTVPSSGSRSQRRSAASSPQRRPLGRFLCPCSPDTTWVARDDLIIDCRHQYRSQEPVSLRGFRFRCPIPENLGTPPRRNLARLDELSQGELADPDMAADLVVLDGSFGDQGGAAARHRWPGVSAGLWFREAPPGARRAHSRGHPKSVATAARSARRGSRIVPAVIGQLAADTPRGVSLLDGPLRGGSLHARRRADAAQAVVTGQALSNSRAVPLLPR